MNATIILEVTSNTHNASSAVSTILDAARQALGNDAKIHVVRTHDWELDTEDVVGWDEEG